MRVIAVMALALACAAPAGGARAARPPRRAGAPVRRLQATTTPTRSMLATITPTRSMLPTITGTRTGTSSASPSETPTGQAYCHLTPGLQAYLYGPNGTYSAVTSRATAWAAPFSVGTICDGDVFLPYSFLRNRSHLLMMDIGDDTPGGGTLTVSTCASAIPTAVFAGLGCPIDEYNFDCTSSASSDGAGMCAGNATLAGTRGSVSVPLPDGIQFVYVTVGAPTAGVFGAYTVSWWYDPPAEDPTSTVTATRAPGTSSSVTANVTATSTRTPSRTPASTSSSSATPTVPPVPSATATPACIAASGFNAVLTGDVGRFVGNTGVSPFVRSTAYSFATCWNADTGRDEFGVYDPDANITLPDGPKHALAVVLPASVPLGGTLTADTCEDGLLDTVLSVSSTGCFNTLAGFVCDAASDDVCSRQSVLVVPGVATRALYFLVTGFGGRAGPYVFNWAYNATPAPPTPSSTVTASPTRSGSPTLPGGASRTMTASNTPTKSVTSTRTTTPSAPASASVTRSSSPSSGPTPTVSPTLGYCATTGVLAAQLTGTAGSYTNATSPTRVVLTYGSCANQDSPGFTDYTQLAILPDRPQNVVAVDFGTNLAVLSPATAAGYWLTFNVTSLLSPTSEVFDTRLFVGSSCPHSNNYRNFACVAHNDDVSTFVNSDSCVRIRPVAGVRVYYALITGSDFGTVMPFNFSWSVWPPLAYNGSAGPTPTITDTSTPSPTPTQSTSGTVTGTSSAAGSALSTGTSTGTATSTPSGTGTTTASGTPTATRSGTTTATPSGTSSNAATPTPSGTLGASATSTATRSGTGSGTPSSTPTQSGTGTPTGTPPGTVSGTPAATATTSGAATASISGTGTPASTPTGTSSNAATPTPSGTLGASATNTATGSATATVTGTPTSTPSAAGSPQGTPSVTATATATASLTGSVTARPTLSPTSTLSAGATPSGTASVTQTPPPTSSATSTGSRTGTPASTPSVSGTAAATQSITPSGTPTGSITASSSRTQTATGSTTGTPPATPTATPTPSVTPSRSETPPPTASASLSASSSESRTADGSASASMPRTPEASSTRRAGAGGSDSPTPSYAPLSAASMSFTIRLAGAGMTIDAAMSDPILGMYMRQDAVCAAAAGAAAALRARTGAASPALAAQEAALYAPTGAGLAIGSDASRVRAALVALRDGTSRLLMRLSRGDDANAVTGWEEDPGPCPVGSASATPAPSSNRRRALQGDAPSSGGSVSPSSSASPSPTASPSNLAEALDVTLALDVDPPAPVPAAVAGGAVGAFNWQRTLQAVALEGARGALADLAAPDARAATRLAFSRTLDEAAALLGLASVEVELAVTLMPVGQDVEAVSVEAARPGTGPADAAGGGAGGGGNAAAVGGGIAVLLIVLAVLAAALLLHRRRQRRAAVGGADGASAARRSKAGVADGWDFDAGGGAVLGANPLARQASTGAKAGRHHSADVDFGTAFGAGAGGDTGTAVHTNALARARSARGPSQPAGGAATTSSSSSSMHAILSGRGQERPTRALSITSTPSVGSSAPSTPRGSVLVRLGSMVRLTAPLGAPTAPSTTRRAEFIPMGFGVDDGGAAAEAAFQASNPLAAMRASSSGRSKMSVTLEATSKA